MGEPTRDDSPADDANLISASAVVALLVTLPRRPVRLAWGNPALRDRHIDLIRERAPDSTREEIGAFLDLAAWASHVIIDHGEHQCQCGLGNA